MEIKIARKYSENATPVRNAASAGELPRDSSHRAKDSIAVRYICYLVVQLGIGGRVAAKSRIEGLGGAAMSLTIFASDIPSAMLGKKTATPSVLRPYPPSNSS